MPAPLARGIIIAASVIVAAGIAAYENPQFREWFDRSREKIAIALQSTLDDIRPPRSKRDDPSMNEDPDEKAEERRRTARQEILERGKKLEELRKRNKRKNSDQSSLSGSDQLNEKRSPSFDTLVDEDGKLRTDDASMVTAAVGESSAVQAQDPPESLRPRGHTVSVGNHEAGQSQTVSQPPSVSQSSDFSMLAEPIDEPSSAANETWESQYEREMRNTFNMQFPLSNRTPTASTHPSESLIDLTPTTEDFPDPDYSVPSGSEAGSNVMDRTEYFSIPPSRTSTRSATAGRSESDYYYAHPSTPLQPVQPRLEPACSSISRQHASRQATGPSSVSVAASSNDNTNIDHLNDAASQFSGFESEDSFSELGDGIRTPASAWTEVGSTISSSDAEELR